MAQLLDSLAEQAGLVTLAMVDGLEVIVHGHNDGSGESKSRISGTI